MSVDGVAWSKSCLLILAILICTIESILGGLILVDRLVTDDALGFVHVTLVTVEAVNTSLHRLLDDELLEHDVLGSPPLNHIRYEHVFVKVDLGVGFSVLL